MNIDWNKARDIVISLGIAIGAIAYIVERLFAGRRQANKESIEGRSEALKVALEEVSVYKSRVNTLDADVKAKNDQLAAMQNQLSELQGRVTTYERLISGNEVSPAVRQMTEAATETILKTIMEMDSHYQESATQHGDLLSDIKQLMIELLAETKKK